MAYRILADLVVLLHAAFVVFVVLGSLLALRWRRLAWIHLPAAVWGVLIEYAGWLCPLTPLENRLRRLGDESGYHGGFVEHYVASWLYPAGLTPEHQWVLGSLVLLFNVAIYGYLLGHAEGRTMKTDPIGSIRRLWERLGGSGAGRWLFARLIGHAIPYTGSIRARVEQLSSGRAVVVMRDRRRVRNHLASVHAIALANVLEFATGLAFNMALPKGARAIVTRFEIDYLKKARGTLTASCECDAPDADEERGYVVRGEVTDPAGDVVARATAHWRVRPASG